MTPTEAELLAELQAAMDRAPMPEGVWSAEDAARAVGKNINATRKMLASLKAAGKIEGVRVLVEDLRGFRVPVTRYRLVAAHEQH